MISQQREFQVVQECFVSNMFNVQYIPTQPQLGSPSNPVLGVCGQFWVRSVKILNHRIKKKKINMLEITFLSSSKALWDVTPTRN